MYGLELISFMDSPTVQNVQEGTDALIRCMVKGDPERALFLSFNGQWLSCKYVF